MSPWSKIMIISACWWCQSNASSSQFISTGNTLGCKEAAPLSKSGGTVQLEILSAVEGALLIEMVVYRSMDGHELLQCSHPPETEHCPFAPSERLVRILRTIVGPTAYFLSIADAKVLQRCAIGAEAIRNNLISGAVAFQRFLQEYQRGLFITPLRHEAFENFALVVDGPPQVMQFAVLSSKST